MLAETETICVAASNEEAGMIRGVAAVVTAGVGAGGVTGIEVAAGVGTGVGYAMAWGVGITAACQTFIS